jgi:hypothetical protein
VIAVLALACSAFAQQPRDPAVSLKTSDAKIVLSAGKHAPRLTSLTGATGSTWRNQGEETLPKVVEANGGQVAVTWHLVSASEIADAHRVVFVYESTKPHLLLHWQWEARAGFGPFEHRITVNNLSGQEIWLPMLDSLNLDLRIAPESALRNLYVEKGADTPSPNGTHLENVVDGYDWIGKSSTYAHPVPGEAREIIPAEIVFRATASQEGLFAGIEFSGRTRISLKRTGSSLCSVLGLDPDPGPFKTRIEPSGSFETPTVFLGAFTAGPDGAGNQLRPWVRAVLGNPRTWNDPQYPLTVNNSWGSGMQVDEALVLSMIAQSKELGLEMFHLDAGWFRGVGDWYPDVKRFPRGLAAIADAAHRQGLRFGIWVDWTQAALDTGPGALNVRDPKVHDWLVSDMGADWKPEEFKGQTIDLGVPSAHDYAAKEVSLHDSIAGEAVLKCYTEETRQQFAGVIKSIIESTLTRTLTLSQERMDDWVRKTSKQSIRDAQNTLASVTAGFRAKLGGVWGRLLWACFGGGLVAAALLMAGGFWLGRNW